MNWRFRCDREKFQSRGDLAGHPARDQTMKLIDRNLLFDAPQFNDPALAPSLDAPAKELLPWVK